MRRFLVLLNFALLLLASCAAPKRHAFAHSATKEPATKVWIVSNGFHTSIAVRASDAPKPMRAFDPTADYFVIGWGGRDFYMGRAQYPWEYITSVFLPTASALHVVPVHSSLVAECAHSEIIEFEVSLSGMGRLHDRLLSDMKLDASGRMVMEGNGKSPKSKFFTGAETYIFPKTCNLWAASHLKTAGVPLTVAAALTADNLCWQGRKLGRILAYKSRPGDPI